MINNSELKTQYTHELEQLLQADTISHVTIRLGRALLCLEWLQQSATHCKWAYSESQRLWQYFEDKISYLKERKQGGKL